MRNAVVALFFLALFLVACSHERAIRQQQPVRVFTAMNDNVQYTEESFAGDNAKAIADLVSADCPQGVGNEFVRATLDSPEATLIVYTTPDGTNITCTVLKPKQPRPIEHKNPQDAPDNQTAITVNGQAITYTQVQQALNAVPKEQQDANTTNAVLLQVINNELLRQQAQDINVTNDDIATARNATLATANLTEDQLPSTLARNNITMAMFDASIEQQAKLNKLLSTRLLTDELNVTDEQAREYYLTNTNQFVQPEQAAARFLIITSKDKTPAQDQQLQQEITSKLNKTDFCTLVSEYSDDQNSKDKCGLYLVPRGVLAPNLETAAFSTPTNQTSVVTTNQGVYFIQTVQVTPAGVTAYPQVALTLQSTLRNALLQQRLELYLTMLRANANITTYLG